MDVIEGFPSSLDIVVGIFSYTQLVDYMKISFQCVYNHIYGHVEIFFLDPLHWSGEGGLSKVSLEKYIRRLEEIQVSASKEKT
jgi:hypothetical protein